MGHHRRLPKEYPFRYDRGGLDGTMELNNTTAPLTGASVLIELREVAFTYEKG